MKFKCSEHGDVTTGRFYVVCGRVAKDRAPVSVVYEPGEKTAAGQILCDGATHEHGRATVLDAVLVCEGCAQAKGLIKPKSWLTPRTIIERVTDFFRGDR